MEQEQAKLLRMEEVISLTGLSRAKAYGMVSAGELPVVRMGRSVRVPLVALRAWVQRNTSGGQQAA